MLLRMSTLFLRTLREDPADAEVPSHRLLVRAGYIRRVGPGGYTYLPLGWRVLRKIEEIIRDEMDAMGAQEVHFPALLPKEPYDKSNRWTEYGDDVFRVKDRKGADYMLGPTHEEFFTLLVKDLYSSYKDLPLWIYQIQTKFRDEQRPRAGLLRGREFVMKDSYSFDVDDAGLDRSYAAHRDAYIRIFDRLGLDYVIVSALSGAMGGSKSEEFLTPAAVGEDTYVRCTTCDYAANVEALRTLVPPVQPYDDVPAAHVEDTPDTPTIETLVVAVQQPRRPASRRPRVDRRRHAEERRGQAPARPTARPSCSPSAVPGDREVDAKRLEAVVHPSVVEPFTEEDFAATPGLVRGYIGPAALGADKPAGVRYLLDPRVVEGTRWITGANEPGRHVFDLVAGRDFTGDGTIEAASVSRGRPLPERRRRHPGHGARHRDGPHLPARPQVRRGARPQGARRERQAAGRHDGLLRHRAVARDRRDRRGDPRRHRPVLAAGRRPGRRARRRGGQGRPRARGRADALGRPGGARG